MKRNDVLFELTTGSPIRIRDGHFKVAVYPLSLKEIGNIGFYEYQNLLSALLLNKESVEERLPEYAERDGWDEVTDFQIIISNCIVDEEYKNMIIRAFEMFLKEEVEFNSTTGLFTTKNAIISEKLFDNIVMAIKHQNLLKVEDKKKKKEKKKVFNTDNISEKDLEKYPPHIRKRIKNLIEKRNRGRKNMKEARAKELGMDLDFVTVISHQINYLGIYTRQLSEVLNWTLFQLEEQHKMFVKHEGYTNNFSIYAQHGVEPKKLGIDRHWTLPEKKKNFNQKQGGI